MAPRNRSLSLLALPVAGALALTGCAGATSGASDDTLQIVASTNVYGQIAEEIGGDLVEVTSIVTSGAQDPHSYEASAQDQLRVQRAALIIENGGGYDAYMDALIDSSGSTAPVITAVEYSHAWPENEGHDEESTDDAESDADHAEHDHVEGFNEHVWYDPHTIVHVAEDIAEELAELLPEHADEFEANAAAFAAEIDGLEASLADIDAAHLGDEVFVTEPVSLYLTQAAGLENVTPEAFTEAVEEGQDVPPATLLAAQKLLRGGTVSVVIANAQTGGAETTAVIDEADAEAIPVLEFTETLPEGETYISWMQDNIEKLSNALGS